MQHQAYSVHSILKQGVRIESIAAYDKNVILGTDSGQLIMYSVDDKGAVDMKMFNKNFSKKPIVQMAVISEEHLLFVLTDGMLHVCDISRFENNFAHICTAQQTKGCNKFALDVKSFKSSTGEIATAINVCCATKKSLQFFYWKYDLLEKSNLSIELKDAPKSLCLIDDYVCIGFKDEYVLYTTNTKNVDCYNLIEISSHSVDPCICLLKNNILGVSKDVYLVSIDPTVYTKRNEDVKKRNEEINKVQPLMWSGAVLDMVWDEPFVIARLASGLEIRCFEGNSITKETLVQVLPELSKVKLVVRSNNGILFAAAKSELWCIRMTDIADQRYQLMQQKQFQLAIDLMQISEEPYEIKHDTIRQIRMRYARELFASKHFMSAMKQFELASADPYDVIRLFPNLLPDKAPKSQNEALDAATPSYPIPELKDKDLENALLALTEFLVTARRKEIVKLRDNKKSSKSLLSIIATTLLKCYLQTNDSFVEALLRLNEVHLEEAEKTLKKHGKLAELIILYQKNGKHREALELLQSQAKVANSKLYGHHRTINYLQQLGSSHLPLICDFAGWVLRDHPEDGLSIFTKDLIEVENLPRAKVLDFLLIHHKPLAIPYLEHIVNEWNETSAFIHNILIRQYKEKITQLIQEVKSGGSEGLSDKNEQLQQYRSKLYELLKNSKNYSPDVVLADFPTNILLEERALILGRLKKHEKVLAIYIQVLGDVQKASDYCEENYDDDKDIFVLLLKTIMCPQTIPPYEGAQLHADFLKPNQDIIVNLLNKFAVKISPDKIFDYLPDDMPLYRLRNYLEIVTRHRRAQDHHDRIKQGLLRAEISRVQSAIRAEESKSFEITENTLCPDCNKRFTSQSAFVRYPNGEVVHLSCYTRKLQLSQQQQKQ